jgi:asparagine synthase (glutamine-hydrolysing)
MCGIAGIAHFDDAPADMTVLRRMAAHLAHRGPDGEGFYAKDGVGFAHRRLAIIDLAGGAQPFVDPESGLALVYNGEVYNYREIRAELGDERFRTDSDTEVVLRAWRRWGMAAIERFRGMFAFALHDPARKKIYLVRDRLGIKPLYYQVTPNGAKFASELGALAAASDPGAVDAEAVSQFLRYGYVPTPLTVYRDVRKLEPGCCLTIDLGSGNVHSERYWQLHPTLRPRPEAEALEELQALLRDIIRLYVRSDVAFGAFLSGGVDSSLVTALMGRELEHPVRTFAIGFDDAQYSELTYAEAAAHHLRTHHRSAVMSGAVSHELLLRLAARFGEPFADSSSLPTWYVSHLAAQEVKMVLSGDGGDELFAGYDSYPDVLRAAERQACRPLFAAMTRVLPRGRIRRFAEARSLRWETVHHRQRDIFSVQQRQSLTGQRETGDEKVWEDAALDPVTRCQMQDLKSYLPDDILVKVDRMSMDNSLEVRVPLLDHKLVEFALTLPLELRIRGNGKGQVRKYLLRKAAAPLLPQEFLERRKWGFGIPLARWLKDPLRALVCESLDAGAHDLAPYLDPAAIRRLVRDFYGGQEGRAAQVWLLLALRLWHDAARAAARKAEPALSGAGAPGA